MCALQLSRSSITFRPSMHRSKAVSHSLKTFCVIQAFLLAWYLQLRLSMLMFLKQRGWNDLPMIQSGSLSDPSAQFRYGRKAQFRPCCVCQQVHTGLGLCRCVAGTPRWSLCPQHHSRQIDGATVFDVVAWIWLVICSRTRILAHRDATSPGIGQPSGGSSPRWCWY